MTTFSELGIKSAYIKALEEINIINPTEIQKAVIPILLDSKTDLTFSQTGAGKIASFGLPVLSTVDATKPEIQGLIIAPTRKVVKQVKKQLYRFTKYVEEKIFIEGVYEGENIERQTKDLERPTHILVATPERLLELIDRDAVDISKVKTLILHETDELLSMGFQGQLRDILGHNTPVRNIWLFSAIMTDEIQYIVKTYMSVEVVQVHVEKEKETPEEVINEDEK